MMTTAKDTLQDLSSDPVAQRLAKERETAVLMHRHLLAASRQEGRVEGRAEGLIVAVRAICKTLGIEVDASKEHQLSALTDQQLASLVQQLTDERRWPEGV